MILILEVLGQKARQMGNGARKEFRGDGTIGRLRDNDWVLPDNYISGHHARISMSGGTFYIEDTSTNGVFLGSPQHRLPRGRPQALHDGDVLFIDDYEIRVSLGAAVGAVPAYGGVASGEDPFFSDEDGMSVPEETDPLRLLGVQREPTFPQGPRAANLAGDSPLNQFYRPPSPSSPLLDPAPVRRPITDSLIPDDYDPLGSDDPPPARAAVAAPPATPARRAGEAGSTAALAAEILPPFTNVPPPVARPSPGGLRPGRPAPRVEGQEAARMAPASAVGSASAVSPAPGVGPRVRRPEPSVAGAPPLAEWPDPAPAPPVRRAPPPAPAAPSGPAGSTGRHPTQGAGDRGGLDFAALLAAAGIEGVRPSPELAAQFGQILRVVVSGLMDVLHARERIKDEFRMRMTTFKVTDNNPLKFSANLEDALHNLLVKRNAAYLGPVDAFEDAFQDVRNHQMAMLAGVRVAYEAMLNEFDPGRLQQQFDGQLKGGSFLGGASKTKYWELYRHKFHDMVKDADSSFRTLFGDEFAKAYEAQLERLKSQKR